MPRRTPRPAAAAHLVCALLLAAAAQAVQPPAPPSTDETALRPYLAANGLLHRGMYDLTAAEYRDFLAKTPDHEHAPSARYGLAVSLFRSKDLPGAEAELIQLHPIDGFEYAPEVAVMLGQCRLARAASAEAADCLRAIAASFPNHDLADDAAALHAEALYRAGRWTEAVAAADAFAEAFPQSPLRDRTDFFSGLAQLNLGRDAPAAERLASLLERSPRGELAARATLLLAGCRARTGESGEAETLLRGLIRSSPDDLLPDAMLALAEILHNRAELREAAEVLDSLVERFPQSAVVSTARLHRARIWFDTGDYHRALAMLSDLERVEGAPEDEIAYWSAKCSLRAGRERDAADRLISAVQRFPESPLLPAMRYDLAVAQVRTGDQEGAATTLGAFLDQHPVHPLRADATQLAATLALHAGEHDRALSLAGDLGRHGTLDTHAPAAAFIAAESRLLAGHEEEAEAAYRAFLRQYPEHTDVDTAAFRLGTLRYRAGDVDEAQALLAPLANGADTPELYRSALLLLGDLAFRRADWSGADRYLADYLSFDGLPSRDDALLKLGISRQRQGNPARAMEAFAQLIAEHGESPHIHQARLERAQILQDTGHSEEAARTLDMLAQDPGAAALRPYARLRLAGLAEESGDLAGAEKAYADAATSTDNDELRFESLYHQARLAAARGDHRGASDAFGLVAAAPEHRRRADAAARRVISLSRAGDLAAAVTAASELEAAGYENLDATLLDAAEYEKAWCLRALDRDAEAAAAYQSLLDREIQGSLAAYAALDLAELKFDAGDAGGAKELLQRVRGAAEEAPSSVPADLRMRAAYRLGVEALRAEHFEEAAGLLEEVGEDTGASGSLAVSAGLLAADALTKLGRHGQAARRLQQVLEQEPDDASRSAALLRLGDVQAALQAWPASEGAFTDHIERFPESDLWFQARFGRGWARENQGRTDEALIEYRAVVEHHNGATAARAQFQIGECLYAMERYNEAVRELLKVDILYAYPQWSAAALYEAGRCFEAMNDRPAARRHFEVVRERFPESRWAQLAAERLEVTRIEPPPGR